MNETLQRMESPEDSGKLIRLDEPTSPQALMRRATDVAGVCREIVLKTACEIQGRKFVRVEGWESIATAHGCFVGAENAERVYDKEGTLIGYKATGVLRNAHGQIIATGEGFVGFDEKDRKGNPTWKNRAEYAGKAMAQTRAISRTCRGVFAHVIVLIDSNLSTTPAEEVPDGGFQERQQPTPPSPKPKPAPKVATEKTRAGLLDELLKNFDLPMIQMWAVDRKYVRFGESLDSWPLEKIPTNRAGFNDLIADCRSFASGSPKPKGTPQSELEAQITKAGFTFDQFRQWAVDTGNLEDGTKYASFAELPQKKALHWLATIPAVLKAMREVFGSKTDQDGSDHHNESVAF